jgi:hypothetical protein
LDTKQYHLKRNEDMPKELKNYWFRQKNMILDFVVFFFKSLKFFNYKVFEIKTFKGKLKLFILIIFCLFLSKIYDKMTGLNIIKQR